MDRAEATELVREGLLDFTGIPFDGLPTDRSFNPNNYQLARQVVEDVISSTRARLAKRDVVWVTVPVDPEVGSPREPTPVLSKLDFAAVMEESFEESLLRNRMSCLLLVPVVKPDVTEPKDWWISLPAIWTPDEDEWGLIEKDYELIRETIRTGRHDTLSSGAEWPGRIIVPKTNGAKAADTHEYVDAHGRTQTAKKYGFYVRPEVIHRSLDDPPRDKDSLEHERVRRLGQLLDELADLDARYEVLVRREQALLRRSLLGDARQAPCALCGRSFPAEFLVAAHIKPRSACTTEERMDIPSNAMLACRFGCDELFERGHVTVDSLGIVRSLEGLSGSAGRYLAGMEGRRVVGAWPRGDAYFRWHREHRWLGRSL